MSGGEKFEIFIYTSYGYESGRKSEDYVDVSQSEWRLVHIPLDKIEQKLRLFGSIGFYFPKDEKGSICIDDISFVQ